MSARKFWLAVLGFYCWCNSSIGAVTSDLNIEKQDGNAKARKVLRVDGDIMIGALFPVHRKPPSISTEYSRTCGSFWEQYGIHRVETFVHQLKKINADNSILPNVTLGCDIRDSCWYAPVALEQSIDFIKNSIASLDRVANKSSSSQCGAEESQASKPIVGLIGPGSSGVTMQVQNLLQLFNVPQIGYSATSEDLSNKANYKYFMRVVPPDTLQAQALADLIKRYNWTYVSTVYTADQYGKSGMEAFKKIIAESDSICLASNEKLSTNPDEDEVNEVMWGLSHKYPEHARVVICFCQGYTVTTLFKAMKRLGYSGRFLIIGSDGWNSRPDVVEDVREQAVGGISIRLYSPPIDFFDGYYHSLKPSNNSWNPWFKQFWQEKFKCYLDGSDKNTAYKNKCTGNESLKTPDYVQDGKLGFVINAIYAMAYALHNMHHDLCKGQVGICKAMQPVNGSLLLEHLKNVTFPTYSNDSLMFDEKGDPPGRYDIMNYQRIRTGNTTVRYAYKQVGSWDTGTLVMDDNAILWPGANEVGMASATQSVCSKPCGFGSVKTVNPGAAHCCWVCRSCADNEILLDEETCQPCQKGWWPNKILSACIPIPIEHIRWSDTEAVVAIGFTICGLIMTGFTSVVFIRYNDTPVVKASTRELSYIILIGIVIAYLTTIPLIAKPSIFTCYLTRILPGLAFSMVYGALVTKTNRISRILSGSKKKILTRKPRFMSASAQVIIAFIIVGIECILLTAILIYQPPDAMLDYPEKRRVRLICNTGLYGITIPLGYDFLIIMMCTFYAVKTRNLPENFNEAKFIGFAMYTTCVVWVAFVPIYLGSDSRVVSMCLAISICATVALVLLFWPKVYIIIWKPEKNQRSAFTTSKDIRCHIGSQISKDKSTESIQRYNTADCPASGRRYKKWSVESSLSKNGQRRQMSPIAQFRRQSSIHVPDTTLELVKLHANGTTPSVSKEKMISNSTGSKRFNDTAVQTGEELLKNLVPSLRKRRNRSETSSHGNGDLRKSLLGSDTSLNSRTSDEFFLIESDKSRNSSTSRSNGKDQNILENHKKLMKEKHFGDEIVSLIPRIINSKSSDNDLFESCNENDDEKGRQQCHYLPIKGLACSSRGVNNSLTPDDNGECDADFNPMSPLLAPPRHDRLSSSRSTPSFTSIEDNNHDLTSKPKSNGCAPEIPVDLDIHNSHTNLLQENVDIPTSRYLTVSQALIGTKGDSSDKSSKSTDDDQLSWQSLKALDREEDSVYQFQEYLRSRGVDLDLNTVQSSDV